MSRRYGKHLFVEQVDADTKEDKLKNSYIEDNLPIGKVDASICTYFYNFLIGKTNSLPNINALIAYILKQNYATISLSAGLKLEKINNNGLKLKYIDIVSDKVELEFIITVDESLVSVEGYKISKSKCLKLRKEETPTEFERSRWLYIQKYLKKIVDEMVCIYTQEEIMEDKTK